MNEDILQGQWKQVKGNVQQWWGKLTNDDVDRVQGNVEELIGVLQERYGWERQKAEAAIDEQLKAFRNN
ncbi:MAG: CsbD family protein [Caldilineaceae bacterium]|nr:CsbD family protein [Caldilineaceae bacterium]